MATATEPFSFVVAELSDKYIGEFPDVDLIPRYMETVRHKTGVQVITGYGKNNIGIKGSWMSLSMAHAFLVEFLATNRTAEQTLDDSALGSDGLSALSADNPSEPRADPQNSPRAGFKAQYSDQQKSLSSSLSEAVTECGDGNNYRSEGFGVPSVSSQSNETLQPVDSNTDHLEQENSADDNAEEEGYVLLTNDKESNVTESGVPSQISGQQKSVCVPKAKRVKPPKRRARETSVTPSDPSVSDVKSISKKQMVPKKPKTTATQCDPLPVKAKSAKCRTEEKHNELSCSECGYKAVSKKRLSEHIYKLHKGSACRCDVCGKVFPNPAYMQRHKSSHTDPQHCCDICGKMFKVKKAMIKHRRTHEDGYTKPSFQCEQCPKMFCSQYIVDCHVKSVHMGQKKSYLCSYCGKKFTTKHSLQEHSNAHTGSKPHVCEICGKGFSYDSALRDHKFTHEEVKQFQCPVCCKTFCQRSGLKMHMRIHEDTKKFQCGECGREFTQKQALQRHERVHKGVKPFMCKHCSRSFSDASIIRRHLILVHKTHKSVRTWREDIICTVKPDTEHRVGLVSDRTPLSKKSNGHHVKAKQSKRSDSRKGPPPKGGPKNLKKSPNSSSSPSVNIPTETLDTQNAATVFTDNIQHISKLGSAQVSESVTAVVADCQHLSQKSERRTGSAFQAVATKMVPVKPQPFQLLRAALSTLNGPNSVADNNTSCTGQEQQASSTREGVGPQLASVCLQPDTANQPGFPPGPFVQKSNVSTASQPSASPASYPHLFDSDQNRDTVVDAPAILCPTTSCVALTDATSSSLPSNLGPPHTQPWHLYYYYSRLASQMGVNFSDFEHILNSAVSRNEQGYGHRQNEDPASLASEHLSAVGSSQSLSLAGHSSFGAFPVGLPHITTEGLHENDSSVAHGSKPGPCDLRTIPASPKAQIKSLSPSQSSHKQS